MNGSSWAQHDHEQLMRLAGKDPHSIVLLSALFDNAVNEDDVDIETLRDWCAETFDRVVGDSLNIHLASFPALINQWRWVADEAEAQRIWHQMLASLYTLRNGEVPCGLCIDIHWNVSQHIAPAERGDYCASCCNALARIPRGRHMLRAVAS